tara:strand:+ start:41 stop:511 length:471 start_codon:yes stop_codon:yes gene_type:complete
MSFSTKFLLIIFLNFLALKIYTIDIPKDLIVKVIKESENEDDIKSKSLDLISVKYTGWIFDNNSTTNNYCDAKGKMFDSNILEKFQHTKLFQFVLGQGIVIKGWDLGLQNMGINEQRCLVIPSHLAYGNRRIGDIIKPNSTLIFEVELIKVLKIEK